MRLCVFVWSSLTLPVLGKLNPRLLCEEATSACVCWPMCLRSHLYVFTCILCVFLELRVSLLTGSVCQEGGGGGGAVGGDSGPFETDIRSESKSEAARERASFMWLCIPPRHRQAEAQDKTCVPPSSPPPPTSTPALPSVPSLHPSPVSVTLTFIKKPHAGIPFQHLCVDARFQHVHVHIHTHTSLWGHCMDLTWLSLFKMTSDKLHFAIKKTFFAVMKPSVAWNFCHRGPR